MHIWMVMWQSIILPRREISQDPAKMVAAGKALTSKIITSPGFTPLPKESQALHYVEMGYILFSNGAYHEARQYAHQAIHTCPRSKRAWLAYCLMVLAGEHKIDFSRLKAQIYNRIVG